MSHKLAMIKLKLYFLILFALTISCDKESVNGCDFVGQWIEKGIRGGCAIEFTGNGSAFLNLFSNDNVHEYNYRIYESTNSIFFSMLDNTDSEWSLKYSYDDTTKELTIWGLYISIPERPSKTILIKA